MIETDELTKYYGEFAAVRKCNLRIERGEVFGLLGPNGAGKTTLLRMLLGMLTPTSGVAKIDGIDVQSDPVAVHKRLAYVPGDVRLFRHMRGIDLIRFFAEVRRGYSVSAGKAMASRLALDLNCRVSSMSTGMRQKLALAATFAAEVPLYLLDEPTANLDPNVRQDVGHLVREAQQRGATVLFSSHVLSEVEATCDRVAILQGGRVAHEQVVAELRRKHRITAELSGELPELPSALRDTSTWEIVAGDRLVIEVDGDLAPMLGWLAQVPMQEVQIEPFRLQGVYRKYHPPRRTNLAGVSHDF